MAVVPTNESKDTLKKNEELRNKIRDFIISITNNSGNYGEDFMKIKFNSDNDLSLKKLLELYNMIKVAKSVFREGSKYYPQVFFK